MLDRLVEYIGLAGFARMRNAAFFPPPPPSGRAAILGGGGGTIVLGEIQSFLPRSFFLGFVYR